MDDFSFYVNLTYVSVSLSIQHLLLSQQVLIISQATSTTNTFIIFIFTMDFVSDWNWWFIVLLLFITSIMSNERSDPDRELAPVATSDPNKVLYKRVNCTKYETTSTT